ncbi:MAG: cupredoxin domain-containing protein [Acidobacteria bacterium]|nr:cupredoxin domain-containing protein [Acidobacteriota bacterium]
MTVRAASQQLVHDQNISATIVQPAAPGYTISVNPLSRTIAAGATTTYQVTVASQNDFSGQVALGLANVPNTVLSTFNTDLFTLPANGSVTSTLSLTAQPNSPSATSTITVNAVSLGFPARSQNITLTVTPPQGPQTAQVSIQQFQFSPTPVTVAAGGQVRWTNLDGTQHTVVADGGQFSSGVLGNGQTFSTMPAAPGTYNYHCSIHPSMTGTVIVQ